MRVLTILVLSAVSLLATQPTLKAFSTSSGAVVKNPSLEVSKPPAKQPESAKADRSDQPITEAVDPNYFNDYHANVRRYEKDYRLLVNQRHEEFIRLIDKPPLK
ncbi:hypothetical protein AGMMS50229_05860 [Campylobacterota bacterium]|nr:hypothetical protein AGMMS50229_05860 [Campylobacterota bacterium]